MRVMLAIAVAVLIAGSAWAQQLYPNMIGGCYEGLCISGSGGGNEQPAALLTDDAAANLLTDDADSNLLSAQ